MKNKYGLDVEYYTKELNKLVESLPDRSPDELWRYLDQLKRMVDPDTSDPLSQPKHKSIDFSQAPKFEGHEPIAFRSPKKGEYYSINNKIVLMEKELKNDFITFERYIYRKTPPKETQQEQPALEQSEIDALMSGTPDENNELYDSVCKYRKEQHTDKGDKQFCDDCGGLISVTDIKFPEYVCECTPQQPQEIDVRKKASEIVDSVLNRAVGKDERYYKHKMVRWGAIGMDLEEKIRDTLNTITGRENV